MTIRDLLDELGRIDEMRSLADSKGQSNHAETSRSGHLLAVAIDRAQTLLQARFSASQIEAATRMRQILSEEAA